MLNYLRLENVGPAPKMDFEFAPRLNLLTGDNGLGKSFVLDVAWWVLAATWARQPVIPARPPAVSQIGYSFGVGGFADLFRYERRAEPWLDVKRDPPPAALVLYAEVDGGFAVWDPARSLDSGAAEGMPRAFHFSAEEVWSGSEHCEGLIRDWASWQRERNGSFAMLKDVLLALSPSGEEPLAPGELRRISIRDPKDYPTLRMPYGEDVAVVHASAGMRRIIALSYLLVWAWREHLAACQLLGQEPTREVIFLVDEVEAHLHPRWQRVILPALLSVMDELVKGATVQAIVATHSPLVLASMEGSFDAERDRLLDLELVDGEVVVRQLDYEPLGTADDWLTSDAIGLRTARGSVGQEQLLTELAEAWNDPDLSAERYGALAERLQNSSLPAIDPVRTNWLLLGQRKGFVA